MRVTMRILQDVYRIWKKLVLAVGRGLVAWFVILWAFLALL